jgi:hypothetical protein
LGMHSVDGYALASADRMMLLCPSGLWVAKT